MWKLRAWQREALHTYFKTPRTDYTVTATPGAGKTTFALMLAKRLKDENRIDRIIIVCPTDHLRTQWAEVAETFGFHLDTKAGNQRKLRTGVDGYVTTYAQVAAHPILHQRRTELPNRSLVLFDEIHHAGDGLSWGDAVREAFTGATRRVALTGTPFRTSPTERIPFVEYTTDVTDETLSGNLSDETVGNTSQEGALMSVSDYSYGYGDALLERVVRPVIFAAYTGTATWKDDAGEVLSAELGQIATKKDESIAWRTALNPRGNWVRSVITAANTRLDELRKTGTPDAGCLILASDQETARQYAKIVEKTVGQKPAVILSDDANASKKISEYSSDGTQKFIVAVRMVSEGVDIPRLCVLVWLTAYQTPMFFAQAVGRVVRARAAHETATVFIPTVRPLLTLAANMEQERTHIIKPKPEKIEEDEFLLEELGVEERIRKAKPELLGAEARFGHMVVSGKAILPTPHHETVPAFPPDGAGHTSTATETVASLTDVSAMFADDSGNTDLLGFPGFLTPEQEALLLAEEELSKARERKHQKKTSEKEKIEKLQEEITFLAKQLARTTQLPLARIYNELNTVERPVKTAEAPLSVLQIRRDWLLRKTVT